MTVETLLGLDEERMAGLAAERWADWVAVEPRLGQVRRPSEVAAWRRHANPKDSNEMLLGLARLAAFDGGDDRDAALVLAWLLLPIVLRVRRELEWLNVTGLDDAIAAQLWLEVRSIRWRSPHRVAFQLASDVREGVLVDSGVGTRRHRVVPVAGSTDDDRLPAAVRDADAAETLVDVLAWARAEDVISEADHALLVSLIVAARTLDERGELPRNGGACGLASNRVTRAVAEDLGICQRTIRRRAAHCVQALGAASSKFLDAVGV
jgi:hypothetical protein